MAEQWSVIPTQWFGRSNAERKNQKKRELLEPYVGDRVLHVGCRADGFEKAGDWLHGWLAARSETCVGIDLDAEAVERGQAAGYDVRQANAETFDLDKGGFDTVVATNVIEHLTRPGAMLARIREHLPPEGRVIVTTPRTFTPWTLARDLKGGIETPDEHVMWYCRDTLETMLEREGFAVENYESWGWRRVGTCWYEECFHTVENAVAKLPGLGKITDYQHFIVATPAEAKH